MPVYCYTLNKNKKVIKKWVSNINSLSDYKQEILQIHGAIYYEYNHFDYELGNRVEILSLTNYTKEEVTMNYMLGEFN